MSKLERIMTFIDVVEENGFAAAARKQGLSTAAISRQITALEAELGIQLLRRTTRQIALTEIGAQYYETCKKAINGLIEAETEIAGSQSEATGLLKIMGTPYFGRMYLLPKLSEFMQANPKLRIKIQLEERLPNLADEGIDVLFGVSLEGIPGVVRKQIAELRYVLCASPEYLKKHGTPKVPADVMKHKIITHSGRKPDNSLKFKDGKEVYFEPYLWLNDTNAMRECALEGLGLVSLHDYMVGDALKDKRLVEVLPDYQLPKHPVYLYYLQSRYLQPKVRHFIDFFTESSEKK